MYKQLGQGGKVQLAQLEEMMWPESEKWCISTSYFSNLSPVQECSDTSWFWLSVTGAFILPPSAKTHLTSVEFLQINKWDQNNQAANQ